MKTRFNPLNLSVQFKCLISFSYILFYFSSWVCLGYNELWSDQGSSHQNNVVSEGPRTEEIGCGKCVHQKHGWFHWQQGPVWHILSLWEYFVLQGKWIMPHVYNPMQMYLVMFRFPEVVSLQLTNYTVLSGITRVIGRTINCIEG